MTMKQISVFVENRPGRLCEITAILKNACIDIRALTIADTTDFGILRLIVDEPDAALKALKDAKLTVSITNVIGVCLRDEPGGLNAALEVLHAAGVSVEYCYAFISHSSDAAHVILRVDRTPEAIEALSAAGFTFLNQSGLSSK